MEIRFRKCVSPDTEDSMVVVVASAAVVALFLSKPGSNIRQKGHFSSPQPDKPKAK